MNTLLSKIEDSIIESACSVVATLPFAFPHINSVKSSSVHYTNGDYVIQFNTSSTAKIDMYQKRLIEDFLESEILMRHPYPQLNAQVIVAIDIWYLDRKRTICIHYEI